MGGLRALLDRLPTPVKVALWLALSGALTSVAHAVTNGQIQLDAPTLAIVNVVIVALRDVLDAVAPAGTGQAVK